MYLTNLQVSLNGKKINSIINKSLVKNQIKMRHTPFKNG